MKKKRKSLRGMLIKGALERVPSSAFEIFRPEIETIARDASGIYALYKNNKPYYIGLAKNLNGRILSHLERDRHVGKWDKFSIYIIKRVKYLKDLETLLLRVSKPKGNKLKGGIPKNYRLNRKLQKVANIHYHIARNINKALSK